MIDDRFGGRHSEANASAIASFEIAVWNVLAHRPQAAAGLDAAIAAAPDMIAAHALRGFCGVSLARRETIETARLHATQARMLLERQDGSTSERRLVAALDLAVAGRLLDAAAQLETRLGDTPGDLLAFKLSHGLRFMCGDAPGMLAAAETAASHWSRDMDGFGFLLGCRAFAFEENGSYREAETIGREAVALEPFDAWGAHAVGHVYEMQNLSVSGVRWLEQTRGIWSGCNNFSFHMAWHLSLCHMEQGRFDAALDMYDSHVRPISTDDFRDFSNAASLLLRLAQNEIDVGDRWDELAAIARRRADDTSLVFASLHYLLALLATGDLPTAATVVDALVVLASKADDQGRVARSVGSDVARALTGRRESRSLASIARGLGPLGGSKAQRDVFVRALIDLAVAAGDDSEAGFILASREKSDDRFERATRARFSSIAA